jgi:zinc protease
MSKKPKTSSKQSPVAGFDYITKSGGVEEYVLKQNGLRVLHMERPHTGVVTSNITYIVGARDEARGKTGAAHMLEHMLFKPTTFDIKNGIDSAAMKFERDTGCVLNANTWKDRTTYYFSYPAEHLERALKIEAERMTNVVLTDKSLTPERNNVLSEFDMNNGSPYFALDVAMLGTAYHSHPYGHETIGYREDIESYTADMLDKFYKNYYRPNNATLMIIGDVDLKTALQTTKSLFSHLRNPSNPIPRYNIREFKQEGLRRVEVERPSDTNIINIGFKQNPFPTKDWFVANVMLGVLAGNSDSIINKLLVDTGKATSVSATLDPASEENLAGIIVTLAEGQSHAEIEALVLHTILKTDLRKEQTLINKVKARMIADELFSRDKSLDIVHELTEYVASRCWTAYGETPKILSSITPSDIEKHKVTSFINSKMTIGYFKGVNK